MPSMLLLHLHVLSLVRPVCLPIASPHARQQTEGHSAANNAPALCHQHLRRTLRHDAPAVRRAIWPCMLVLSSSVAGRVVVYMNLPLASVLKLVKLCGFLPCMPCGVWTACHTYVHLHQVSGSTAAAAPNEPRTVLLDGTWPHGCASATAPTAGRAARPRPGPQAGRRPDQPINNTATALQTVAVYSCSLPRVWLWRPGTTEGVQAAREQLHPAPYLPGGCCALTSNPNRVFFACAGPRL